MSFDLTVSYKSLKLHSLLFVMSLPLCNFKWLYQMYWLFLGLEYGCYWIQLIRILFKYDILALNFHLKKSFRKKILKNFICGYSEISYLPITLLLEDILLPNSCSLFIFNNPEVHFVWHEIFLFVSYFSSFIRITSIQISFPEFDEFNKILTLIFLLDHLFVSIDLKLIFGDFFSFSYVYLFLSIPWKGSVMLAHMNK